MCLLVLSGEGLTRSHQVVQVLAVRVQASRLCLGFQVICCRLLLRCIELLLLVILASVVQLVEVCVVMVSVAQPVIVLFWFLSGLPLLMSCDCIVRPVLFFGVSRL